MPTILPTPEPPGETAEPGLGGAVHRLRERRGWIIALGVLCALSGLVALALVETATIASVLTVGVFMVMVGVLELVIGFRTRSWGRMVLWEVAGLLYLVAGLLAVALPELASVVITLLLGAGLLATGITRIVLGYQVAKAGTRPGLVLAGLVTALLGILIVVGWPGNSAIVLGTFLGIDLLLYGITWVVFGIRLGRSDPSR